VLCVLCVVCVVYVCVLCVWGKREREMISSILCVCFHPRFNLLVTASQDNTVKTHSSPTRIVLSNVIGAL